MCDPDPKLEASPQSMLRDALLDAVRSLADPKHLPGTRPSGCFDRTDRAAVVTVLSGVFVGVAGRPTGKAPIAEKKSGQVETSAPSESFDVRSERMLNLLAIADRLPPQAFVVPEKPETAVEPARASKFTTAFGQLLREGMAGLVEERKDPFQLSDAEMQRLRDCLFGVLCDLLRCLWFEFCHGQSADDESELTRLGRCVEDTVCRAFLCVADALCPPTQKPEVCPPRSCGPVHDLPCNFAVE